MLLMFNSSKSISSSDPTTTKPWVVSFFLCILFFTIAAIALQIFVLSHQLIGFDLPSPFVLVVFFFKASNLCKLNNLPFNKFCSLLCTLHRLYLWPRSKMSYSLLGHPCIIHLNTMHTTPYIHKPNENLFNQL